MARAVNQTTAHETPALWDDVSTLSPGAINPTGPDGSMTVITDAAGYLGCLQADAVGESCTVQWQLGQAGSTEEGSL